MRDYQLSSPSLDGILHHDSIVYEGVHRPFELLRVLDGPASRAVYTKDEEKAIQDYFQDLHHLFMKKFSNFVAEADPQPDEGVKLQAMLQEMIKIKKLL